MASPDLLRNGSSCFVTNGGTATVSGSVKNGTVGDNEAINQSSIIDDPINYDVNAHLLINLDTSGIHTPPDITLLTQFGDNDEENDCYSSTGSPEESNFNNYDSMVYSANHCPDLNISNEDLESNRETNQKPETTQGTFPGNNVNNHVSYLQTPCNYDTWNAQRANPINGNNVSGVNQQYSHNFNDLSTNCGGIANQGQCAPTTVVSTYPHMDSSSSNRNPLAENIYRHNYSQSVNMFNNIGNDQPIQQMVSPLTMSWMTNVNNYSNPHRMTKCGVTEANGWCHQSGCGNIEKLNMMEDPNFRNYSKPSTVAYNRFPAEERLSSYGDHGLGTLNFNTNHQTLKALNGNGTGYCGFVLPFNNHWQLLNVNESNDQKSMVNDSKLLSPQPMAYMRPNYAPRPSLIQTPPNNAQSRPQLNYQPVPAESQTTYMPIYFQFPHLSGGQKSQFQQQNVSNMNRCNFLDRSAESHKISNNVLDKSAKPVQLPRSLLRTDNVSLGGNPQSYNNSNSTGISYEHSSVGSMNYLPSNSQPNSINSNVIQPAKSIRETLLNSQQNCVVYSNISNHLADGHIVKQNTHLLPPFQENFGANQPRTSGMEAISKRYKGKNSYVTVKQLLMSRRTEGSTAVRDQSQEHEASAKSSTAKETDKSIATNSDGEKAAMVVTKSISEPIPSALEERRKRSNLEAISKSNDKICRKKYYKTIGKKTNIKLQAVPQLGAESSLASKPLLSILQSRLMGLPVENASQLNRTTNESPDDNSNSCSSMLSIESQVAEIHGIKAPTFQMYLMNDNRRNEYRPPRHYDLLCLTLGSFRVVQSVSAPASNKLKVYFIKKSFVYEFDISHLRLRETVASIEVPFSLVTAIHCEDGEVLISVAAAPKMYLGVKQKRSGAVKSVAQFDKEHPTDITEGQLGKCKTHKLNLKNRQAENLRSYLLMFEKSFKDLFNDPICLDENEATPLPIRHITSDMLSTPDYSEKIPKVIVSIITCHCQVSCRTNRCSCMKSKSKCGLSGSGCLCRGCDNPLNILEAEGVDLMRVLMDNCLVQKIVNFKGDLLKLLNSDVRLECCQTKTKLKFCIPGKNTCENGSCEQKLSFKYSWCQQELCYEDNNPRNHCFACKTCKDPIDLHCEVCRKCNPIGGNGARCTFCGNVRDTTLTENEVISALMRYRNGPAASPKVYQVVQVANKATFCRLETTSDSLDESLDSQMSTEQTSQVDL